MKKRYLLLSAVLCFSMITFAGCGNKDNNNADVSASPAAEESMTPEATDNTSDNAAKDGEDALDDVGDATRDAVDDAGNAVKDAVDDAGNMMDDATDGTDDTNGEKDNATDNNNSVTSGKKNR